MYDKHGKCAFHYSTQENLAGRLSTSNEYLSKAVDLALKYHMGRFVRKFYLGQMHSITDMTNEIDKQILHKFPEDCRQAVCVYIIHLRKSITITMISDISGISGISGRGHLLFTYYYANR